jgi:predicted phosphodiesterase
MKKYAVLSDIHGNSWALKAVLEDIRTKGIGNFINLGDIFYGPLDPAGTAEVLDKFPMDTVHGNEDRLIYEIPGNKLANTTLEYVVRQLSEGEINWLRQLPKTKVVDREIFLCHGTPDSDTEYLLEEVRMNRVGQRSDEDIARLVKNIDCPIILCGHSHVAKTVRMRDGRMIVNAGSVGLPAYSDDTPRFHKMEAGFPHASYVLLKEKDKGWDFEFIKVAYDWEKAANRAGENGREDWGRWLRTGRA